MFKSIYVLVIAFLISMSSPELLQRSHRSVVHFPTGASNGLLIAIAIPLEIPGRTIFLSHNFEVNYGLPTNASQFWLWYDLFKNTRYNIVDAVRRKRNVAEGSKFSRRFVYELLAERMDMYGYNGTACILKAICESFELPLHHHNGVLGDITHIMFSPSTSEDEDLPRLYYQAETDGSMENCAQYQKYCPIGIFDLVSEVTYA